MIGQMIKNWVTNPAESQEQPVNPFTRQAKVPFAVKYKPGKHPVKLTESQINDLPLRLGIPAPGKYELKLALSVIEPELVDANSSNLPALVRAAIEHWRSENLDSDEAARARLMGQLPAVQHVSAKIETAKAAQEEAERAGAELANAWRNFEELPARFEKVKVFLANVTETLASLESPTYDESIRQVLRQVIRMRVESSHLEDGRAARMVGQLPDLMLERDTVPAKQAVLGELKAEYSAELDRLHSENTRLANLLGTEPHQLTK